MKALILIWSLLLPYLAFGQASNADLQYRNDGETLINGSFEQGKKGYTFTVGSGSPVWSTQATTKLTGKAMQLTLSAQTFSFKSNTTQGSDLSGQNGYIEVYLSASTSGAEFCPVVDGVSAPTTTPNECQPIIAGVGFKPYGIQKTFGATSLNYEIRGVSNASYTGVIYADDGSVAKKSIVTQMNGARLFGGVTITGCAGRFQTTSSTFASFGTQTGCVYTTFGQAVQPSVTNLPVIKFASLPAGDYIVEYTGAIFNATTGNNTWIKFHDGTNYMREEPWLSLGTSGGGGMAVSGSFSYSTDQSNITFEARAKVQNGTANLVGTTSEPGVIKVWYFPKQPISTINTSNGWFIDANIGGANIPISTGAVSTYSEMTSASLDIVINTSKGSAPAEIACASGTSSVGLTCNTPAVAESNGIAFIPPKTGKYRACADFAWTSTQNNQNYYATFQLVETPNNSTTILQEGGARLANGFGATNGQNQQSPNRLCGNFIFNDTSKKTIRVMYESAGSAGSSQINADRDATKGQQDIHWTVEPIVENIQASLQGYNSTDGVINPKTYSGFVSGSGSFNYQNGNLFASCTYGSPVANRYNCIPNSGKITTSNVVCTAITNATGSNRQMHMDSASSASSILFGDFNATGGTYVSDTAFFYICHVN